MSEILDIVNDSDEVIGQAERDEVHRTGLVCRLIYVCFYTADREIILQKRSLTKKNDPGRLTTAVSGHVSSGQDYLTAVIRESLEETGVEIEVSALTPLGVLRADYVQGDYVSNAMRGLFAYTFDGVVSDLKVEAGDGAGFISLSIEELERQLESDPDKFAVALAGTVGSNLLSGIKSLLNQ